MSCEIISIARRASLCQRNVVPLEGRPSMLLHVTGSSQDNQNRGGTSSTPENGEGEYNVTIMKIKASHQSRRKKMLDYRWCSSRWLMLKSNARKGLKGASPPFSFLHLLGEFLWLFFFLPPFPFFQNKIYFCNCCGCLGSYFNLF